MKNAFALIGMCAAMYFLVRIILYWSVRCEDAGKDYGLLGKILHYLSFFLGVCSLPVSAPFYLLDSLQASRLSKKRDRDMRTLRFLTRMESMSYYDQRREATALSGIEEDQLNRHFSTYGDEFDFEMFRQYMYKQIDFE